MDTSPGDFSKERAHWQPAFTSNRRPMADASVDISIVIVTWNVKRYVQECLGSLRRQAACPQIEVIVVDNASSDGTTEFIAECFPYVKVIQNKSNLGYARANNIGLQHCKGKYICLVNPDINLPPDCLAKIFGYMEQDSSVGMLGPRMLGPDGKVRRSCMRFPGAWNVFCRAMGLDTIFKSTRFLRGLLMHDFGFDRVCDVDVLNGWFWVVRREALEQVGPLDERFFMYGEDTDWCYRFHQNRWRTVFYPEAQAVHYGGASSASAPVRFYIEMCKADAQFWRKHHRWLGKLFYLAVLWLHEFVRLAGYATIYWFRKSSRQESVFKMRRSAACLLWLAGLYRLPE